jgi:hypothetical protein
LRFATLYLVTYTTGTNLYLYPATIRPVHFEVLDFIEVLAILVVQPLDTQRPLVGLFDLIHYVRWPFFFSVFSEFFEVFFTTFSAALIAFLLPVKALTDAGSLLNFGDIFLLVEPSSKPPDGKYYEREPKECEA